MTKPQNQTNPPTRPARRYVRPTLKRGAKLAQVTAVKTTGGGPALPPA